MNKSIVSIVLKYQIRDADIFNQKEKKGSPIDKKKKPKQITQVNPQVKHK